LRRLDRIEAAANGGFFFCPRFQKKKIIAPFEIQTGAAFSIFNISANGQKKLVALWAPIAYVLARGAREFRTACYGAVFAFHRGLHSRFRQIRTCPPPPPVAGDDRGLWIRAHGSLGLSFGLRVDQIN